MRCGRMRCFADAARLKDHIAGVGKPIGHHPQLSRRIVDESFREQVASCLELQFAIAGKGARQFEQGRSQVVSFTQAAVVIHELEARAHP